MAEIDNSNISGGAVTKSNFDAVLKEFYEGPVREHLNNSIPILEYIEKSKRSWSGRHVRFPIHLRRNHGVGARAASGFLPTAGRQQYEESQINVKQLYGRIELIGLAISASEGDKGSFASALRTEVDGLRRDLRVDLNRQIWGNKEVTDTTTKTGVLCQVNGGAFTVTTADAGVACTFDNPGTRYLKKGMLLNADTPANLNAGVAAVANAMEVVSVTSPTVAKLRSLDGGSATVADDMAICKGDLNDIAFDHEITGLSFIVSDSGTLQTIDPTVDTEWVSTSIANGGTNRPLSLELMQLAIDNTDEVSGTEPNLVMGHHSIRREYINLLTADVRYAPEQLRGGFQKLTYAGGTRPMPIEFDRMAPYNKLFFMNTNDIKMYVMKDWAWADRDGSTFSRKANSDSWEAFMCWYGDIGCERRFSHTLLEDITVDNLIF
jgi:hypothetical protein